MNLTFKRDALLNTLNIALKAVSSKTTMAILECILIDAREDGVYFTSNDMELGIETKIPSNGCLVTAPGRIAVDAKLFSDIVRKIAPNDDSDINLESDGTIVKISCDNSVFKIQEKDPDQFPEFPKISEDKFISVSQFTLKEVIRDTIFSIAVNDSNKMMTGELFEVNGDKLKVASLDGHRISIRNTELKESYGNFSVIIPGKTLNEISKIISGDADKPVSIYFSQNYVLFRFDDTQLISRLIDGEYFKIDSMLSTDYETKVTVNRQEFLENIERSTILIRENDKRPLVFDICEDHIALKINSTIGSMDAQIPVKRQGKDLLIGFNPKFLMDALRVIDDEEVSLYLTNQKSPCFIRDDEERYIYLILPVNFNPASYEY